MYRFMIMVIKCLLLMFYLTICAGLNSQETDYSNKNNWACFPEGASDRYDVFFVAPTVFFGNDSLYNMPLNDDELRKRFIGAVNMEMAIYDNGNIDFYAPFYAQAGLNCFVSRGYNDTASDTEVEQAFLKAYNNVASAFEFYLSQSDDPFILAGFSQGSEMLIRLMKDRFHDSDLHARMIAAYCIGWRLTEEDLQNNSNIKPAETETDLGVIICYSTESESIEKSLIVPESTFSINPLNWTNGFSKADMKENSGACFTDYSGAIVKEIPYFTGAYIDEKRGTLKVTDVNPKEYPPKLGIFREGEYHIYDYMFFCRNLQKNVQTRINQFMKLRK